MEAYLTPTSRMAAIKSSSRGSGHRKRLFSSFLRSRGFLFAADEAMARKRAARRPSSSFQIVIQEQYSLKRYYPSKPNTLFLNKGSLVEVMWGQAAERSRSREIQVRGPYAKWVWWPCYIRYTGLSTPRGDSLSSKLRREVSFSSFLVESLRSSQSSLMNIKLVLSLFHILTLSLRRQKFIIECSLLTYGAKDAE